MDIRKVKKLIELLEESGISEIEISEGEESVRISRHPPGSVNVQTVASALPVAAPPQAAATPANGNGPAATAAAAASTRGQQVTAPMVGTFYSGPAPGAKPFVEIGTEVKPGDTLCVIEAMKMENILVATQDGEVKEILAKRGESLAVDQPIIAFA